MKKMMTSLLAFAAILAVAQPAIAGEMAIDNDTVEGKSLLAKERFQVRARVIGVLPEEDSTVDIGGDVGLTNAVTPEVDLTYFMTDHIAAELIAATVKHKADYNGTSLGKTWILPPTLTLQYHFMPDQTFSPYLGAGVNYSVFYNEKGTGFDDFDAGNGVGYALQAGTDIWLTENWGLNLDVKKLFLDIDASVEEGTVNVDLDVDPWIVGAGVSYRF